MVLAADISYRLLIDPDWGSETQLAEFNKLHGSLVDSAGLSHAIGLAAKEDDALAMIGLLRMVGRSPQASDARAFLIAGGSKRTPLVEATLNGQPHLRYEAAAAIMRLNPTRVVSWKQSLHSLRVRDESLG